jgi:predicted AAA+ superfamily ATPase
MDFSTLAIYNPWWQSDKSDEALCDSLLKGFNDKAFKREYTGRLDMSGNGVFIVRGMRQIGKSTLMKTEIASLIRQNQRRTVLYLPLDTVTSFEQLRVLLLRYLQFTEAEKKRYIFIDEITMVDQWQRAIKEVRDNTAMGEDVFVLSGSSAWDLKRDSERLPGRKGDSQSDYVLLPVTFPEYLTQRIQNLPPKKNLQEILKLTEREAMEWSLFGEKILVEWEGYRQTGGIPSVIESRLTGKNILSLVNDFWDILIGDIERLGLSRAKLVKVLDYTVKRISTRFSWNAAASEIEMDTKTFQKYVEALGANFVLLTLKALDTNTGYPSEKKQKKLYFSDYFFLEVLRQKMGIIVGEPASIENQFVVNCVYSFGRFLENGLDALDGVGYWYSKEGSEVDLLVDSVPIELKYQNHIQRSDLSAISKTFKRGIIVSKQSLNVEHEIKIIPIHLFLAMI